MLICNMKIKFLGTNSRPRGTLGTSIQTKGTEIEISSSKKIKLLKDKLKLWNSVPKRKIKLYVNRNNLLVN